MSENKEPQVESEKLEQALADMRQNLEYQQQGIIQNVTTMRALAIKSLTGSTRDINQECKYPDEITIKQYKEFYKREGIAARVVNIAPDETWNKQPDIKETQEPGDTEFEVAWKAFEKKHRIYHYLHRIDKLSGIGRFGVLLIGINDGLALDKPLSTSQKDRELMYLRPFDESVVTVKSMENNPTNPRFGFPDMYEVQFEGTDGDESGQSRQIHHSRIVHVADGRQMSETFGTPRMESTFNRLSDLTKILAGSGEMFWKGAFPGLAFEVNPEVTAGSITTKELSETIRGQVLAYSEGLQRYLAVAGVSVKSLVPQMANPEQHFTTMIRAIAVTLGIPYRIFLGSEEAKLASSTDSEAWKERLDFRREDYITPFLLRPFIDRMIEIGVLQAPKVDYVVEWPPLTVPNEKDKAEVANLLAEALERYVQSRAFVLIDPVEFLTTFLGFKKEKAEAMITGTVEDLQKQITDDSAPVQGGGGEEDNKVPQSSGE